MADAPRWEDLFPQEPEPAQPAQAAVPPLPEEQAPVPAQPQQPPAQQYPPTQVFPQQGFPQQPPTNQPQSARQPAYQPAPQPPQPATQPAPQQWQQPPAAQPAQAQQPGYQPPRQQPPAYQPPPLQPPAAQPQPPAPVTDPPAYRAPAEGYQLPPVPAQPEPLVEPPQRQSAWPAPPAAQRAAEQAAPQSFPAQPAAQSFPAQTQPAPADLPPTQAFPAQAAAREPLTPPPPAAQQPPAQQPAAQQPPIQQPSVEQPEPTQMFPAQPWQLQPPEEDAPTRAFDWQQPATPEPGDSAPAVQQPVETAPAAQNQADDPFAALFGGGAAAASTPESATQDDPFATLWAQPAESVQPAPREAQADPFASLFASQPATGYDESGGRRAGRGGGGGDDGGNFGGAGPVGKPRKKRSLLWLKIILPIVLVLGAVGGVAAFAWFNYNEQVRELLGIPLPTDYEGTGNGTEVIVTITSGDIGSDVANTLHRAGVTMTFDAVYDYLVEHPEIGFTPGNWSLQEQMSAESAVTALQDPANKVTSQLLIIEGSVLPDVLELISATTGIPLEEVQAAAADPTVYGVVGAPSLEGYLFPATYELDGSETASQILQRLVDETFSRLDALGVPAERRHEILTMAGLIQREAGSNPDDFFKVSRVFWNRIEQGMLLQSDATVAYGTGNLHTVWTTDAERADPANPYNTYVHPGLPVGPIGAPGELAIEAALQPADGPWLYFVPINLATGETAFSETAEEHQANVDILLEWCEASAENASYCE